MSNNEPPQHLHLLSSFEAGWDGLQLIYELEPADEIPETHLSQHLIIIPLDNCRASFMVNGSWQHVDYSMGDIGIFPSSIAFPKTQTDRSFRLIDLFLERTTFAHA